MTDYRAPIKDALFTLRHVGELEALAKAERYTHADFDTVATVLEEQGRFMQEVFAPLNQSGDVEGLKWDDGEVTTPAGFKEAYAKFVEAGWQGLNAEGEYGGAGFPEAVFATALEFMTASNGAADDVPRAHHRRHRMPARHGDARSRRRRYLRASSRASGPAR